jgi:hypothetical protein
VDDTDPFFFELCSIVLWRVVGGLSDVLILVGRSKAEVVRLSLKVLGVVQLSPKDAMVALCVWSAWTKGSQEIGGGEQNTDFYPHEFLGRLVE